MLDAEGEPGGVVDEDGCPEESRKCLELDLSFRTLTGRCNSFTFPGMTQIPLQIRREIVLWTHSILKIILAVSNFAALDFGAALQPLRRLLPTRYADGKFNALLFC